MPSTVWRTVMQVAHEKLPPAPLPGMQQPWSGDTLRDTDRHAVPHPAPHVKAIDRISDLLAHDTIAGAVTSRATGRPARPEKAAIAAASARPGQHAAMAGTRLKPRSKVPKIRERSSNPELAVQASREAPAANEARPAAAPAASSPAAVAGNVNGGGTAVSGATATGPMASGAASAPPQSMATRSTATQSSGMSELDRLVRSIGEPPPQRLMGLGAQQ